MDIQGLLQKLLKSGQNAAQKAKDLAGQGVDFAADKLGVPEEQGADRDAALSNLGKGAAVGGLVALLLGTKTGRKIAGPALKIGTLAALGGLGYKIYSDWSKAQGQETEGHSIENLDSDDANNRSKALITAMVASAKCDGQVDTSEMEAIRAAMAQMDLDQDQINFLMTELTKPLDLNEVVSGANDPASAVEIYLTSLMFADPNNADERSYLDQLASAMNLSSELTQQLEEEAFAVT